MSPLTFNNFSPVQSFRRSSFLSPTAQDYKLMADYIIPVLNQQRDFCYECISHRHLGTLFHLYSTYFGDLYSSIQNLWDLKVLAEREMPDHPFYNCISAYYDFQHKHFHSTQTGIKLLSWKPSIYSFDSFIFSL